MQKSILIIGQPGSGKTTAFREITLSKKTDFTLDGAVSTKELKKLLLKAKKAKSFCVIACQMDESEIPENVLKDFEIIRCEVSLKFIYKRNG